MKKRVFQDKWENLYFFTEVKDKIQCLICQQMIAVPTEYNICQHYDTTHREKYDAFTGKIQEEEVQQLKAAFAKQRNFFLEINKSSKDSVRASFVIREIIAKSPGPFTEGLFVKECLVKASEILCPDQKKVFEGISSSASTVACRIMDLVDNVQKQLIQMAKDFKAFSIALDESTDVSDTTQCAVFIKRCGFFNSIHCILHQEALCSKSLQMKEVMDVVVKTIIFIYARVLNHRQFISFLASMDSEYGELLHHTQVRWLCRGDVLKHFFALREEIDSFMKMKNKEVPQLADSTFICNLPFLADVTAHLNALNLKLQGRKRVITQMYDSVKSFKVKLTLWGKQLTAGNLVHCSTVNSLGIAEPKSLKEYADIISNIDKQFDVRFKDFKALAPHFQLLSTPFAKYTDVGIPEFYQFLSQERFPMLFSASARVMAMFANTYTCEQFFSSMRINKSVLRLVLSQDIKPNTDALVDAKRCQLSAKSADVAGKQTGLAHQCAYPGEPCAKGCRSLPYRLLSLAEGHRSDLKCKCAVKPY
uniref:SPIN-DOC-like zinc-finger domain-containing protein n=1 Tax=Chelonoidis abingdonii TaxID=106734 RepID=A0A8C0QS43_CHEAB